MKNSWDQFSANRYRFNLNFVHLIIHNEEWYLFDVQLNLYKSNTL